MRCVSSQPAYETLDCNQWEEMPASMPGLSAPLLAARCANQRPVGGEQADMNTDVTVTWIVVWSCSEAETLRAVLASCC